MDKLVIATKNGFGSRLCEGKVLAPLTSIVLDGTHLVYVCLCALKKRFLKSFIRNETEFYFF